MNCAKNMFSTYTRMAVVPTAIIVALALSACSLGQVTETTVKTNEAVPASKTTTPSEEATATSDTGAAVQPVEVADSEAIPHPSPWKEITDKVAAGAKLLCVDTADDYSAEHVNGATNVPSGKIDAESEDWDKDAPLVLTSSAEAVARSIAGHLARNGFTEVYYLAGGYDEWGGTFEGSDAREATVPSKLYYIYATENYIVIAGDMSEKRFAELSLDLADSMEGLADEFEEDIDVEVIDANARVSRTLELIDTYDIPITMHEGMEGILLPRWVLVDSDGRVTHLSGLGSPSTNTLYGWCCDQAIE